MSAWIIILTEYLLLGMIIFVDNLIKTWSLRDILEDYWKGHFFWFWLSLLFGGFAVCFSFICWIITSISKGIKWIRERKKD